MGAGQGYLLSGLNTPTSIFSVGLLISAIGSVIISLPKFMMGKYTHEVNIHEEFCTLPGNITHPVVQGDEEDSSIYMAVLGLNFFYSPFREPFINHFHLTILCNIV